APSPPRMPRVRESNESLRGGQGPLRVPAVGVAHERRMDAVAEELPDAFAAAGDDLGRNRKKEIFLRSRPRLTVLMRDRQPLLGAAVLAAAVDERAEKDDRRAGRHTDVAYLCAPPLG